MAEQLGGGSSMRPSNTPKLALRMCSFLALRRGFFLGCQEAGSGAALSDYLGAARHKFRCFGRLGVGGMDREILLRFFFLLWMGEEGAW